MGIGLGELGLIFGAPALKKTRGLRVLDIGCSNVYGGSRDEYEFFLTKYGKFLPSPELRTYCDAMQMGGEVHPIAGGVNGAWLGDLLQRAGNYYVAYDLFEGYNTRIFDLNFSDVPEEHRDFFDIVINCGTTEHVLNQFNCFRVIHEATRVGGLVYHAIPMIGYLDHGYFNYKPRLFFELAAANGYRLCYVDYSGPEGAGKVLDELVTPYQKYGFFDPAEVEARWGAMDIPDSGLRVLLEKTNDRPFRTSTELSTALFGAMTFDSEQAMQWRLQHEAAVMHPERRPMHELLEAFRDYHARKLAVPLPLGLERRLVTYELEQSPSRTDLRDRLAAIAELEIAAAPLLRLSPSMLDRPLVRLDGVEAEIVALTDADERYRQIIHAYHRYAQDKQIDSFPLGLEQEALHRTIKERPDDYHLALRLGRVLSAITLNARLPDPTETVPELPLRSRSQVAPPKPSPSRQWVMRFDGLLPRLPPGLRWRWVALSALVTACTMTALWRLMS